MLTIGKGSFPYYALTPDSSRFFITLKLDEQRDPQTDVILTSWSTALYQYVLANKGKGF